MSRASTPMSTMSFRSIHIYPQDKSGLNYIFEIARGVVVQVKVTDKRPPRWASVEAEDYRMELTCGGGNLRGYCAREDGKRRALMLLYLPRRDGKVYCLVNRVYHVELGDTNREVVFLKGPQQPAVMGTRWINSQLSSAIRSDVLEGDFDLDELVMLVPLAVFYLVSESRRGKRALPISDQFNNRINGVVS